MTNLGTILGTSAAMALATGLLGPAVTDQDRSWAHFLIGAVMALALWVGLYAGSYALQPPAKGVVTATQFVIGAVFSVGFGLLLAWLAGGPAFLAVGTIMAIALVPAMGLAKQDSVGAD